MADISTVVERLEMVRDGKRGQYMARCPAHEDRSPSLKVSSTSDGRILMHCYAGCDIHDITAAIGMSVSDLFPDTDRRHYRQLPDWKRRQYEGLLMHERFVVEIFKADRAKGKDLKQEDADRYRQALQAIRKLEGVLHG